MQSRMILCILVFFLHVRTFAEFRASDWMTDLNLSEVSLNQIALPGTHNSASSEMTPCSKIAKGQDISHHLNIISFLVSPFAYCWSKAQDLNILEQLNIGVRFLDLRIVYRDSTQSHWAVHGLYSQPLGEILDEINDFSQKHPSEIILIRIGDLRYMNDGNRNTHYDLVQNLFHAFSDRYVSNNYDASVKVGELWRQKRQIIIFYDNDKFIKNIGTVPSDFLWSKNTLYSPWIRAQTVDKLWQGINNVARLWAQDPRRQTHFWGIGANISPDQKTIIAGLNPFRSDDTPGSLRDIATVVNQRVREKWLSFLAEPPFSTDEIRPNIVKLDFIDAGLVEKIIGLNASK